MENRIAIRSPHKLLIADGAVPRYGASQAWYPTWWQRTSGCGPTNGTHLLWYLAATRPGCRPLCDWDASERAGMLRLMRAVWNYVTPGAMGVHNAAIFTRGMERYGRERGVPLRSRVLEIPDDSAARPTEYEMLRFLTRAFSDDLPVAFLNRSNGALDHLESWHWVTLVAAGADTARCEMYDQGWRSVIDLGLWLRTARRGGALVALEPGTAM